MKPRSERSGAFHDDSSIWQLPHFASAACSVGRRGESPLSLAETSVAVAPALPLMAVSILSPLSLNSSTKMRFVPYQRDSR